MTDYAIVDTTNDTVVRLVTYNDPVATHPNPARPELEWIDITDVDPRPQVGWTYDGTTFSEPVVESNQRALTQKARSALNANANFQALQSPTNAQVLAQVQSLTRQANLLIRLVVGQLDSTSGT
jgi:hypothetical protein